MSTPTPREVIREEAVREARHAISASTSPEVKIQAAQVLATIYQGDQILGLTELLHYVSEQPGRGFNRNPGGK